jgi:hypothetical protein
MDQYVQELVFLQGDDASEFFGVLYPKGMQYKPQQALEFLREHTSEDGGRNVELFDPKGMSGQFSNKYFIMTWNYAYNWVALYLKVTKKELRAQGWKETRNREMVKA